METTADKLRALGLAIGLHLLLVALLFVGLLFQRERPPLSVAGGSIEAVLTETLSPPSAAPPPPRPPARPQPEETAPPPQPRPEPRPQDSPEPPQPTPQAPVTRPDTVDQERVLREAAEKAENEKREQEERRRQEQVLLEEQKQKEEAERRQRLAQQQAERDKQLADIRRQREEAEKRRKLEEEKLKQLADRREQAASQAPSQSAPPSNQPLSDRLGNQGTDDGLQARYTLAIQQQVDRNWLRPDNLRPGLRCYVTVTQMVGGQVTGVDFSRCPADDLTRRSIEASLMREPLPYRGYESVFERRLNIPFCYPIEVCAR